MSQSYKYIMFLLTVNHHCSSTRFTGILRSSSSNQAIFEEQCIDGIYFKTPIKTLIVETYIQCVLGCLDEKMCKSFNFKDSIEHECELLLIQN